MTYLIILLLSAIMSFFGPWWIGFAVAFVVSRLQAKSLKEAVFSSIAALGTLWLAYALFLQFSSGSDIALRMADILVGAQGKLGIVQQNSLIFGIMAFITSTLGGLAGLAGYHFKSFSLK